MEYRVNNIYKSYDGVAVLEDVSLGVEDGKTTCVVGPTGCGKTTLLHIVSGLVEPDSGDINGFKDSNISFVFQEDRLIEWKTVMENLVFVLKGKMDKNLIYPFIMDKLKSLHLDEYKDHLPGELSGGMRQKISILRAFSYPSEVLLLDEPFKSLDVQSKRQAMDFFKELMAMEKRCTILVTHDIDEAIELGDEIVVWSDSQFTVLDNAQFTNHKSGLKEEVLKYFVKE